MQGKIEFSFRSAIICNGTEKIQNERPLQWGVTRSNSPKYYQNVSCMFSITEHATRVPMGAQDFLTAINLQVLTPVHTRSQNTWVYTRVSKIPVSRCHFARPSVRLQEKRCLFTCLERAVSYWPGSVTAFCVNKRYIYKHDNPDID